MSNLIKKTLHYFLRGMNRDISGDKHPQQNYYSLVNGKIISKEEQETGAVTNEAGTELKGILSTGSLDHTIVGAVSKFSPTGSDVDHRNRDLVVLFTHDPNGNDDRIWRFYCEKDGSIDDLVGEHLVVDDHQIYPTGEPPLAKSLGFDPSHRIEAIIIEETDKIKKIYFTDNVNPLRVFRFENDDYNDGEVAPGLLDVLPDVGLSQPEIEKVASGGIYKAGTVQYAYQLYKKYGQATSMSPVSGLVNLSSSNEYGANSQNYQGSPKDDDTYKAVKIKISDIDSEYTYIRVYSLFYDDYFDTPDVQIAYDGRIILNASDEFEYTNTNREELGTITYQEFLSLGGSLFAAKTIETKRNRLVAGNIKEDYGENLEYDARAYRFTGVGNSKYIRQARLYAVDTGIDGYDSDSHITINGYAPGPVYPGLTGSEGTHNCINKFNNTEYDGLPQSDGVGSYTNHEYVEFKYQTDGVTLGGQGPNISYEFTTHPIIIDNNASNIRIEADAGHTDTITLCSDPAIAISVTEGYSNYSNPAYRQHLAGYQRDEIYRFAIVFYDKKGRPYPAKWIGDIRMPSNTDCDTFSIGQISQGTAGIKTQANVLGVVFTVDGIDSDMRDLISGFQIVRVKREPADKTIITQGLYNVMQYYGDYWTDWPADGGRFGDWFNKESTGQYVDIVGQTSANIVQWQYRKDFISPDVLFFKDIPLMGGLYLEPCAEFKTFSKGFTGAANETYLRSAKAKITDPLVEDAVAGYDLEEAIHAKDFIDYDETKIMRFMVDQGSDFKNLTGIGIDGIGSNVFTTWGRGSTYLHWVGTDETDCRGADREIFASIALQCLNAGNTWYDAEWEGILLTNLRKPSEGQYGGNTYSVREGNVYIPASEFVPVTDSIPTVDNPAITVFGGDTYIEYFSFYSSFTFYDNNCDWSTANWDGNRSRQINIPVESSTINLAMRHDGDSPHRLPDTGLTTDVVESFTGNYLCYDCIENGRQTEELYLYNSAYTKENDSKFFIAEYEDKDEDQRIETRIRASEKKIYGEFIDNWSSFLPNNYADVDNAHGQINKLISHRDKILFYQDKAVGYQPIEERSIITDESGATLALGTGAMFGEYEYLSTETGCSDQFAVIISDRGIHHIDRINEKWMMFNGQSFIPVSDILGMGSFLHNMNTILADTTVNFSNLSGVHGVYDPVFGRVYMTFLDYQNVPYTLAYNDKLGEIGGFESFYEFYPSIWIPMSGNAWSIPGQIYPAAGRRLEGSGNYNTHFWKHGAGYYGRFYGEEELDGSWIAKYRNTSIDINHAPESTLEKILTHISFNSKVLSGVADQDETMTKIRAYNSIYDTDPVTLTDGANLKRRGRTWHTIIPRAATDEEGVALSRTDIRMRDRQNHIVLSYTNNANKKIILYDAVVQYLISPHVF